MTGYALSVSLGMLTIVLPAGLGAREGLLTLILSTAMPTPAAAAVAIMSRFIVTIVDVVAALGGWLYARSHHLVTEHHAAADRERPQRLTAPAPRRGLRTSGARGRRRG